LPHDAETTLATARASGTFAPIAGTLAPERLHLQSEPVLGTRRGVGAGRPAAATDPPIRYATGVSQSVDPMAAQMAALILGSDIDELREVVARWLAEAPTGGSRRQYEQFGARMIELKEALADGPQPTREELELALTMMLRLAAQHPGGTGR
jgi:hypothetical protein